MLSLDINLATNRDMKFHIMILTAERTRNLRICPEYSRYRNICVREYLQFGHLGSVEQCTLVIRSSKCLLSSLSSTIDNCGKVVQKRSNYQVITYDSHFVSNSFVYYFHSSMFLNYSA
jgi:hypothetical protein